MSRLIRRAILQPKGVPAVFAWNPADKAAGVTLSNSNLTATVPSGGSNQKARGQTSRSSGAHYFEVTLNAQPGGQVDYPIIGVATAAQSLGTTNYLGETVDGIGYVTGDFTIRQSGSTLGSQTSGATVSPPSGIIGIGYNFSTNQFLVKIAANAQTFSAGTPFAAPIFPCFNGFNTGDQMTLRTTSALGVPAGYTLWNT